MYRWIFGLMIVLGLAMITAGRDLTPAEMAELGIEPKPAVTRAEPDPVRVAAAVAAPAVEEPVAVAQPVAEPEPQPEPAPVVQAVAEPEPQQDALQEAVSLAMASDAAESGTPDQPLEDVAEAEPEAPLSLDDQIAAVVSDAQVRYVNGTKVNVREGPSTGFGTVGQVVLGEAVEILSDPADPWVKIRIQGDGIEGYIAGQFLQEDEPNG